MQLEAKLVGKSLQEFESTAVRHGKRSKLRKYDKVKNNHLFFGDRKAELSRPKSSLHSTFISQRVNHMLAPARDNWKELRGITSA